MRTQIPFELLQTRPEITMSPRSPRNKIQRKPENFRSRFYEDKEKRQRERGNQFIGFYSPKHQHESPSPFDPYQLNNLVEPQIKTLRHQRSLTNFGRGDLSNTHGQHNEAKNKQNSVSNSSGKSSNERRISRLQLQLKALTYENARLKSENKNLGEENKTLKSEVAKLAQSLSSKLSAKSSLTSELNQKTAKLLQTIQGLQIQLTITKQQLLEMEGIKRSNSDLQSHIKLLETINGEQRSQLFKLDKLNKYLEIQIRTLKKQRVVVDASKKLQLEYNSVDADNKRLRKMVSELQSRLKSSMLFDLTPEVSQKSQSFLLD